MLFYLLKLYARLALRIYCRKVVIDRPEYLEAQGPLLFAANHPNSFLDGIILTTLMKRPLYSLARGDAFAHPRFNRLLRWLRLLPVYRTTEGMENLGHNYTTFAACQQVFAEGGIVMIFSEGACVNEWRLRPLRKGTARLALGSWQKGIPLTVVPLGFNYNTFRNFGKNVVLHVGQPLQAEAILQQPSEGQQLQEFNRQLSAQLQTLVYEIDPADRAKLKRLLYVPQPVLKKVLLALPAAIGFIAHVPFYFTVKAVTHRFFNNDHFDSVLTALLTLAYPLYLSTIYILVASLWHWLPALPLWLLLPFCAWACVQLKNQFD